MRTSKSGKRSTSSGHWPSPRQKSTQTSRNDRCWLFLRALRFCKSATLNPYDDCPRSAFPSGSTTCLRRYLYRVLEKISWQQLLNVSISSLALLCRSSKTSSNTMNAMRCFVKLTAPTTFFMKLSADESKSPSLSYRAWIALTFAGRKHASASTSLSAVSLPPMSPMSMSSNARRRTSSGYFLRTNDMASSACFLDLASKTDTLGRFSWLRAPAVDPSAAPFPLPLPLPLPLPFFGFLESVNFSMSSA